MLRSVEESLDSNWSSHSLGRINYKPHHGHPQRAIAVGGPSDADTFINAFKKGNYSR